MGPSAEGAIIVPAPSSLADLSLQPARVLSQEPDVGGQSTAVVSSQSWITQQVATMGNHWESQPSCFGWLRRKRVNVAIARAYFARLFNRAELDFHEYYSNSLLNDELTSILLVIMRY